MSLSRDEAENSLRDINRATRLSFEAYGYKSAAPFLILWGALWAIGYGVTDLWPAKSGWTWLGVVVFGFVASALLGARAGNGSKPRFSWRIAATALVVCAFISATFAILGPINGAQVGAFIPLLIALVYSVMGIWMGFRFLIAGLLVGALTLGGYFYLHEHFALWMACVGGGTLIATGLWLRRA